MSFVIFIVKLLSLTLIGNCAPSENEEPHMNGCDCTIKPLLQMISETYRIQVICFHRGGNWDLIPVQITHA